jgi:hypothetical protein
MTTRGFFLAAIPSLDPGFVESSLTKTGETANRWQRPLLHVSSAAADDKEKGCRAGLRGTGAVK